MAQGLFEKYHECVYGIVRYDLEERYRTSTQLNTDFMSEARSTKHPFMSSSARSLTVTGAVVPDKAGPAA